LWWENTFDEHVGINGSTPMGNHKLTKAKHRMSKENTNIQLVNQNSKRANEEYQENDSLLPFNEKSVASYQHSHVHNRATYYGRTESQNYEQDESQVWWHHQLQRLSFHYPSTFARLTLKLLLSGIMTIKDYGGLSLAKLICFDGYLLLLQDFYVA
jgi:hypothetical protein